MQNVFEQRRAKTKDHRKVNSHLPKHGVDPEVEDAELLTTKSTEQRTAYRSAGKIHQKSQIVTGSHASDGKEARLKH